MLTKQHLRSTRNLVHGSHFALISEDIYLFSRLMWFFRWKPSDKYSDSLNLQGSLRQRLRHCFNHM